MIFCRANFIWGIFILITPPATGKLLHIGDEKVSRGDASDYCKNIGQQLLSIHSYETQLGASELCDSKSDGDCWIGLHLAETGDCFWTDGSAMDYGFDGSPTTGVYPWGPGEPNNAAEEKCIELRGGFPGDWNDDQCSDGKYPLCRMYLVYIVLFHV